MVIEDAACWMGPDYTIAVFHFADIYALAYLTVVVDKPEYPAVIVRLVGGQCPGIVAVVGHPMLLVEFMTLFLVPRYAADIRR